MPNPKRPEDLTERQWAALLAIRDHIRVRHVAPTLRELGDRLGIRNPNGVVFHVEALIKKGYVGKAGRNLSRGLWLTGKGT